MLNLTLLIQGLNFWLAYKLLARFFFKPVLSHIHQRTQKDLFLNQTIVNCHALLKDCVNKKQRIWQNARLEFNKQAAFCNLIGLKPKAQDMGMAEFGLNLDHQKDLEKEELTKILVNKIITMK